MAAPTARLPTAHRPPPAAPSSGNMLTDVAHLWRRQMKRFANNPTRIAGLLIRPLIWLVLFGVALGNTIGPIGGIPYAVYILPGIVAMTVISSASRGGQSLLQDKTTGFLKEVLVAPVSRTSVMLGFAFGITTRSLVNAVLMLLAGLLIGATFGDSILSAAGNLALMLLVLIAMSLALVSITIGVAWLMDDPVTYSTISGWIFYPLFFLSGSLYRLKGLHTILYVLIQLNPLTYGVDAIRQILLGTRAGTFDLWFDLAFVFGFAAIGLTFGLWVMNRRATNA